MADQNDFGSRQMYQGDWECSECGAKITELPFQPDGTRPLFCKECYKKSKPKRF
ncbi:MAG: CxxC-x17-CxxC domain-containing protein [Patescibacteria group bacterium]